MSAQSTAVRGPSGLLTPVVQQILKLLGLAFLDVFGILLFYTFWYVGQWGLAAAIAIITLLVNVVVFVPRLYPVRWLSPGLAMMILMVIYPIIFTFTVAFTNYSDGHLYGKSESIALHGRVTYTPADARVYQFEPFVAKDDPSQLALWLTHDRGDGTTEVLWARVDEPLQPVDTDDPTPPEEFEGFRPMERSELFGVIRQLESGTFGEGADTVSVTSASRRTAARAEQRYVYDEELDGITDRVTETFYAADNEIGSWIAAKGTAEESKLEPGFFVFVGFTNFTRFFSDPALRGPLAIVFGWTVAFAFLSVFTTFVLGLFMALILNEKSIPYRKALRSLLIIPYAIPAVISILAWKGMMNPNIGVFAKTLGIEVPWFSDAGWAKIGIVLINLWLGYPYMMLITSGALQSIPTDIYEAAEVDGAGSRQRFWNITLPLLLVAVGPLLIASFTFNFNNFVVIEAYNKGGPPIPGTLTPAGYTDILISYTYRLAFGSGRGADYGLASAITIVIFFIVATITLLNFRFTGQWEEVSKNV